MAGGFYSSESTPDDDEPIATRRISRPALRKRTANMSLATNGDEATFSGLSMFFEHQELDGSKYPEPSHRQVKHELDGDEDPSQVDGEENEPENLDGNLQNGTSTTGGSGKQRDYRNLHTTGGRAAVSRPVTTDLNSDDEIIVSMKRKRVSDKKIANYLRDSGRVNYSPKTISTRWARIRTKLARLREEQLDKGIVHWTTDDDSNLIKAVSLAEKNIAAMKETAEKSKWELASRELYKLDNNSEYSSRACKERFENLQSGKVTSAALLDTPAQNEVKRLEQLVHYYNEKLKSTKQEAQKEMENAVGSSSNRASNVLDSGQDKEAQGLAPDPNFNTSSRAMDVDKDLTGMNTWMLRTMRIVKQDEALEKRMDGIQLPPAEDMTLLELMAELQARGLVKSGNKDQLLTTVKAARAGTKDLPKATTPADAGPLRTMLAKRNSQNGEATKRTNGATTTPANGATIKPAKPTTNGGDEEYRPSGKKRRIEK